jgi:hypothetical protein
MMDCKKWKAYLPDMLFDAEHVPPAARKHFEQCAHCREELDGTHATLRLLDDWKAPEPGPYFDLRLAAKLREEKLAGPAGLWERLRDHLRYGSNLTLRPIMAASMALVFIVGGGTYVGYLNMQGAFTASPAPSATIQDLQVLDANAQTIQQLNAFDDDSNGSAAGGGTAATSE